MHTMGSHSSYSKWLYFKPTRLWHKGDEDDDDNDFRRGRINNEKRLSGSSCMSSVCPPHVSAQLPQDGWLWNLIPWNFTKICIETPNFVKIGEKLDILSEDLSVCHIVGSDIGSTTVHRTHGCNSKAMIGLFITLLAEKYVRQQYQHNESMSCTATIGTRRCQDVECTMIEGPELI